MRKAFAGRRKVLSGMRYTGESMMIRKQIGAYTVVSRLGGGRYGVCYLAKDSAGRQVVLKRFRRRMWKKNQADNYHEAVILSGLSHKAVPGLLGVINQRCGYFFVLEYKSGQTLKALLCKKHKRFSAEDVYRIGSQLFKILQYLENRSVVHGDISISNIVDDGQNIALLDFGLARYSGGGRTWQIDGACTADVILYLLYSDYHGRGDGVWYEELDISSAQKQCLKRLFDAENGYEHAEEAAAAFEAAFHIK